MIREEFDVQVVVNIAEEAPIIDGWRGDVDVIDDASIGLHHGDDVHPFVLEEEEDGVFRRHPPPPPGFGDQRGPRSKGVVAIGFFYEVGGGPFPVDRAIMLIGLDFDPAPETTGFLRIVNHNLPSKREHYL